MSPFVSEIKLQMKLGNLVGEDGSGALILKLHPGWAPRGVRRFLRLVDDKFFDSCRFFRVKRGFVVQFGISPDPAVTNEWRENGYLADDAVLVSNLKGTLSFANTGQPDSRTTQLFFNLEDNKDLDSRGFAPIGEITEEGLGVIRRIFQGYGSVSQKRIQKEGEKYLELNYPKMSMIKSVRLMTPKIDVKYAMKSGEEEAARASGIPQMPLEDDRLVHKGQTRWAIVGGCVAAVAAFVFLILLVGRVGSLWSNIMVVKNHPYDDYLPTSPSKAMPWNTVEAEAPEEFPEPEQSQEERVQPGKLEYCSGGKVAVQRATELEEDCETAGLLSTPAGPPAKILGACSSDSII